jgi:hypothetical protein
VSPAHIRLAPDPEGHRAGGLRADGVSTGPVSSRRTNDYVHVPYRALDPAMMRVQSMAAREARHA